MDGQVLVRRGRGRCQRSPRVVPGTDATRRAAGVMRQRRNHSNECEAGAVLGGTFVETPLVRAT